MPINSQNLTITTIATAPSPATTGTSLVVASGTGANFPSTPFYATIWPTGKIPSLQTTGDLTSAEIVQVTGISTDTFTIVRHQQNTSAQTIVAGWYIANTLTASDIIAIERLWPSLLIPSTSTIGAWIYPDVSGSQAANAPTEYAAHTIDTLKPQYFIFNGSGVLTEMDATNPLYAANGYSTSHWTDVVSHSTNRYITVAGGESDLAVLSGATATNAINTLETFVGTTLSPAPTGIELDIEGYGSWTNTDWTNYKSFIQTLGTYLHAHSMKLMVDWQAMGNGTPFSDLNPLEDYSNTEYLSYPNANFMFLQTLISGGYLDYVVIDCYDEQDNYGVGCGISPLYWLQNCIAYAQQYISSANLIVGIPSYGVYGPLYNTFSTSVTSGSNGTSLPQATINVSTTTNSATPTGSRPTKKLDIISSNGLQEITYTGKSGTTFTGCSGGSGTLATGNSVSQIYSNYAPTGNVPFGTMKTRSGFSTAIRDPSSMEMSFYTFSAGNTTLNWYNDSWSMAIKRSICESMGISKVHVWVLGGNPWFPF